VISSTTAANTAGSAAFTQYDLGSRFLKFLGDQSRPVSQTAPNPGGGGASEAPAELSYRAWFEGYGQRAHTDSGSDFTGDTRRTFGGVAGIGVKVAPNAMLGLSVDQSHTKIDILGIPQRAKLDLTQLGVNGAYEAGAWTFSAAVIHGFANIDSDRDTASGPANASYGAKLWGATAEANYYYGVGNGRIVPKIGVDWVRTTIDGFTETGGIDAAAVAAQTSARLRGFIGAEIGHTWLMNRRMFDLSGYARVVDIVWQQIPTLDVTSPGGLTPRVVQGAVESRLGIDASAMASYRFADNARLYVGYDGRFRDGAHTHGGVLGVEVRW
jgi:uncharacterized protein with beta-barrel porin domain